MTDKHLQFLAIAALATFLVAGFLYSGISFSGESFQPGSPLLQGLDTDAISSIAISTGVNTITLEKGDGGFVLKEMDSYPASIDKINKMLFSVLDLRLREKLTDSPDFHKDYGVADDDTEATTVSFLSEEGKEIAGIIIGKSLERGSGVYLRRSDDNAVYASSGMIQISDKGTDFLDTKIFDLEEDTIRLVEVTTKPGSLNIKKEGEELILSNIPKGREAETNELEDVFNSLADIHFVKASPRSSESPVWDGVYKCTLESGLAYLVSTAADGENFLLTAQAIPPAVGQISIDRDEKDEELKKKEAILLDVDKAKEFNDFHSGWIYTISADAGDKLRAHLEDLLVQPEEDEDK